MAREREFEVDRIGKYEVTGEIGEGGFGRVVKAWDPTIRRTVAIKLLKTDDDASLLDRFRAEAATTANLHHPNIVTLHEFGDHGGIPYIVMEYLDGKDLRDVIQSGEYIPLGKKVRLLAQAAQGLHAAHRQGIFHRDIKPANIMILQDGSAKIMDFGISRIAGQRATRLTKIGFQIGTLYYMAPEQFTGHDADVMTDIFSFGVTMYEFLSGQYPFGGDTDASLMYQILNESPRPLNNLVPNCPPALVEIVARALQRDRNQRYTSMEDLEIDLRPVLGELERAEAEQLLSRIPVLLSQDKLEEAETLLRRSLLMDPSNVEAKGLRERIRQRKKSGQVSSQVRDLIVQASQHEEQGAFGEAVNCLEQARKLAPTDTDLGSRLERAREQAHSKENSAQLYRTAQRFVEQQEFHAARAQAELAVSQDPGNGPATELLNWLREGQDKELQAVAAQEQIARAQAFMKREDHEAAIAVLEKAERQFPFVPSIGSFLATVRADQKEASRQRMLRIGFERVDALVARSEFEEAKASLRLILEKYPDDLKAKRKLEEIHARMVALQRPEPEEAPPQTGLPPYRPPWAAMDTAAVEPPPSRVTGVPARTHPHHGSRAAAAAAAAEPALKPAAPGLKNLQGIPALLTAAGLFLAVVIALGLWWNLRTPVDGTGGAATVRVTPESLSFRWRSGSRSPAVQALRIEPNPPKGKAQFRIDPPVPWLRFGDLNVETGELRIVADPAAAREGEQQTTIVIADPTDLASSLLRVPVRLTVDPAQTVAQDRRPKNPPPGPNEKEQAKSQPVRTETINRTVPSRPPRPVEPQPEPAPPPRTEPSRVAAQAPQPGLVAQPPEAAPPVETAKRQEAEPAGPPGRYLGDPLGSISWSGELPAGASLVMERERVAQGPGRMTGSLPGVAVRFRRVVPGPDQLTVEESPSAANRFRRIRLRNVSQGPISFIRLDWVVVE